VTFVRFATPHAPALYTTTNGTPRRIRVPVAAAGGPAWSRDGTGIAFTAGTTAPGRADFSGPTRIWTARADGGGARALTHGNVRDGAATWSPDGRRLAFVRAGPGSRSSLWLVRSDGTGARRLTSGAVDIEPSWSPDGRTIAFVRIDPRLLQAGIWLVRPDGSKRHRILASERGLTDPVWSPDGTRLLVEDGRALYSIRANGSGKTTLARLTADARGALEDPMPAWSPDGTRVAFCQLRSRAIGKSDIWTVRADGTGLRRLTRSPGLDTDPSWRP